MGIRRMDLSGVDMQNIQNQPHISRPRPRSQQVAFTEYSASDGRNSIAALRFVGVVCVLGSAAVAVLAIGAESLAVAIYCILSGILSSSLLFAVSEILENLVAIRKNTAHLAGIRSNTAKELSMQERPPAS